MNPEHHVPEALLHERATRGLPPALDLFAACHLTLCPLCRQREAGFERVAGALLLGEDQTTLPPQLLAATLARISEVPPPPVSRLPARAPDPVLPAPLAGLVGSYAALNWSRELFGCRRLDLPLRVGQQPARLLEFPAGWKLPTHNHEGDEFSLVLTGGFTDPKGHYQRGDVSVNTADEGHGPRIDDDGPCLLLFVHAGRLIPQRAWTAPALWFIDELN